MSRHLPGALARITEMTALLDALGFRSLRSTPLELTTRSQRSWPLPRRVLRRGGPQTEIPHDAQHDGRPPHQNPSRPG